MLGWRREHGSAGRDRVLYAVPVALARGLDGAGAVEQAEIGEVALIPGKGGVFEIRADGQLVWSRHERKRFPEITELKQAVRDVVAPGKSLGHADRASTS